MQLLNKKGKSMLLYHRLMGNNTNWTDGEIQWDTNINNTPYIVSGGWQARGAKWCVRVILCSFQPPFQKVASLLKCLCKNRQPKYCGYGSPWKARMTSLSAVCYSVLTLQISCMQCGGTVSHVECRKTHILWHFLSVESFASDLAPSETTRVPVTSFARGTVSSHEISFWECFE